MSVSKLEHKLIGQVLAKKKKQTLKAIIIAKVILSSFISENLSFPEQIFQMIHMTIQSFLP